LQYHSKTLDLRVVGNFSTIVVHLRLKNIKQLRRGFWTRMTSQGYIVLFFSAMYTHFVLLAGAFIVWVSPVESLRTTLLIGVDHCAPGPGVSSIFTPGATPISSRSATITASLNSSSEPEPSATAPPNTPVFVNRWVR
jgi:hypothetical protein